MPHPLPRFSLYNAGLGVDPILPHRARARVSKTGRQIVRDSLLRHSLIMVLTAVQDSLIMVLTTVRGSPIMVLTTVPVSRTGKTIGTTLVRALVITRVLTTLPPAGPTTMLLDLAVLTIVLLLRPTVATFHVLRLLTSRDSNLVSTRARGRITVVRRRIRRPGRISRLVQRKRRRRDRNSPRVRRIVGSNRRRDRTVVPRPRRKTNRSATIRLRKRAQHSRLRSVTSVLRRHRSARLVPLRLRETRSLLKMKSRLKTKTRNRPRVVNQDFSKPASRESGWLFLLQEASQFQ